MLCKFNCTSSPPKEFFISHISYLSLSLSPPLIESNRIASNRIASHHLPPLHSSLFQDRAGRRILSIVGNLGMEFDPTLRVSFYLIFIVFICFHWTRPDRTPCVCLYILYRLYLFLHPAVLYFHHAPMHPCTQSPIQTTTTKDKGILLLLDGCI